LIWEQLLERLRGAVVALQRILLGLFRGVELFGFEKHLNEAIISGADMGMDNRAIGIEARLSLRHHHRASFMVDLAVNVYE
jgi:hypothetical protein